MTMPVPERPTMFVSTIHRGRGKIAIRCEACRGNGGEMASTPSMCPDRVRQSFRWSECALCHGVGYFGIDGRLPTIAPLGSSEKAAVMSARYRLGVSLFHPGDQGELAEKSPGFGRWHELNGPKMALLEQRRVESFGVKFEEGDDDVD